MNIFLDAEFIDDGKTIDLISIGLVNENNHTYYAINCECHWENASDWVKKNVIKQLHYDPPEFMKMREEIKHDIVNFIYPEKPKFYGWYSSYDWVCFCQLFGRMLDLPKGWPKFCNELKQMLDMKENPTIPFRFDEHHALSNALWNKKLYEWILTL